VDDSARGYRIGSVCIIALVSAADKGHYAMVQHPETDPNTRDNQGERGWMTAPGATE
jgi:hypothetical protein